MYGARPSISDVAPFRYVHKPDVKQVSLRTWLAWDVSGNGNGGTSRYGRTTIAVDVLTSINEAFRGACVIFTSAVTS